MQEALRLAEAAREAGEIPVGAVVVKNGKIVGRGQNRRESGGVASAHAEILAINEACACLGGWRLTGCELYVTLEPCPMCAGAIINSRIKTLVFGAYDSKMGSIDSVVNLCDYPYNHKVEVYGGICEDECLSVLQEFFKDLRKN